MRLPGDGGGRPELRFDIYDWDLLSSPDPLGSCVVPISFDEWRWSGHEVEGWHAIQPTPDCPDATGRLHVAMSFNAGAVLEDADS